MAENRLNLTKAAIEALPLAPPGKRAYYYDTKAKGLAVAVTDRGTKSFLLYRWVKGRPERITLGRYSEEPAKGLTIEQARKAAADANLAIAKGQNPAEQKRAARGEMTLGGLFAEYMARHAEVHNRRPDKPRANYRLYLSHWGGRKLSQIGKKDVQALHARLGRERGRVTANIAVRLLRTMFNRAIEWELWAGTNPAAGVKLFSENSRERFLQPDELPRFFQALADEPNETIRDYLVISLLCGARRGNMLAMRWEEVSLERGEWRIPTTKGGKPHRVPLLTEAVEVLKRRHAEATANAQERQKTDPNATLNPWVFPGTGRKSGHLVEPKKGWTRIRERAELYGLIPLITADVDAAAEQLAVARAAPDHRKALKAARAAARALGKDPAEAQLRDLRIHDLRRTLGSWQAATGASLPMIGRTLAHRNVSTTAIYARLNLDPVRESMQKAATAMMAAGGLLPLAQITALPKRRA